MLYTIYIYIYIYIYDEYNIYLIYDSTCCDPGSLRSGRRSLNKRTAPISW